MSIIDTIKADVLGVLDRHASEIENVGAEAIAAADSPVAKAAAAALHLPASVLGIFADAISKLDAEVAAVVEAHQAAAPASPSAPAEAEPAASVAVPGATSAAPVGNGTGQP